MGTEMVEPFLLIDHNSSSYVEVFSDLDSLANSIEGVDLEDGDFSAFDAARRVIDLRAEGVRRHFISVEVGRTVATPSEPSRIDREGLARALATNLERWGVEVARDLPLEELLWRVLVRLDWPAEAMP